MEANEANSLAKKGALCLTFDNMGSALKVGLRELSGPDPADESLTLGYPKVLNLLDALNLKATFFIEGWNALHHPDRVLELVQRGHEVGLHAWTHETFHQLERVDAERVVIDGLAAFKNIGIVPGGFRAPGGTLGEYGLEILRDLGFSYDSSSYHGSDVVPTAEELQPGMLAGGLPNVPWQWPLIDYYQYFMHPEGERSPEQLEDLWAGHLERAATGGELVTFIIHAFVSGVTSERLAVIERLLRRAISDPRLEILTAGEVAARIQ